MHAVLCVKHTASGKRLCSTWSSAQSFVMTWRGGTGVGKEAQQGGDICILGASLLTQW